MKFVKLFASDESGATAIEYALIASLIAIALVTILTSPRHPPLRRVLGNQLRAQVSRAATERRSKRRRIASAGVLRFAALLAHANATATISP